MFGKVLSENLLLFFPAISKKKLQLTTLVLCSCFFCRYCSVGSFAANCD